MSLSQMLNEYVLVYCTSQGIASIGEPSTSQTLQPVNAKCQATSVEPDLNCPIKMPVWMISIFLVLAAAKYIFSFIIWYIYWVVSTVVIVASVKISVKAAAMAYGHEDSQRVRLERLVLTLKGVKAFKAAAKSKGPIRVRTGSVLQAREDLKKLSPTSEKAPELPKPKRRGTLIEPPLPPLRQAPLSGLWMRFTRLPCFRGFIAFLYMAVPQWYLSQIIDLLLSGQPTDLKLGYGTTSIVLKTAFGGGFAVWTHYCITKPTNKHIFAHFPKGREVLTELWPITAFWAVGEHLPSSLALALSRRFGLKKYAFNAEMWNSLDQYGQQQIIGQFAVVLMVYALVTIFFTLPSTILLRRVYASMLSDEDLAIVPFHRGNKSKINNYDQRAKIHKPGLAVSEAWATVDVWQYIRVVGIYLQYFAVNQLVQIAYWIANWKLQELFGVNDFPHAKLPYSPVGVLLPFEARNATAKIIHSEL